MKIYMPSEYHLQFVYLQEVSNLYIEFQANIVETQ